jgi:hypothetical protein
MVAMQVAEGLDYRNEFIAGWTGPAPVQKRRHGVLRLHGARRRLRRPYRDAGVLALVRLDLGYLWKTIVVITKGEGLRF